MVGPVVYQVIEDIHGLIERGKTLPGGRLPSERELAETMGVSRSSVRAALAQMRDDGWLEIRRGRNGGAYVLDGERFWDRGGRMDIASKSSRLIDRRAGAVCSFSAMMAQRGIVCETRVVHAAREMCPADVCALFGDPDARELFRIERVRSVDGAPVSFEQTYVDPRRFPQFLSCDLTGSIFDALCGVCGVCMVRVEEKIEVVAAHGKGAIYLQKEDGYPVLRVVYQAFDDAHRVAVVSKDAYDPNLVCLTVVGER